LVILKEEKNFISFVYSCNYYKRKISTIKSI
jgi:hypothetical protein